ncbi:MAG TPA: hypothetical protein VEO00_13005, partial [Actinomycetota bacterium]|nr:hypothetical protein [Actinomycetota bacterium]
MAEEGPDRSATGRRLLLFYPLLFAAVAAVVAVSISAGSDEGTQPEIAGGYDLAEQDPCLGSEFDVKQS